MTKILAVVLLVLVVGVAGCGSEASMGSEASTGSESPTGTAATAPSTVVGESVATEPGSYVTVDVRAAYEAVSAQEGTQIVDVREPDEWAATGVSPGAVLIPLGELESRAPTELDAGMPIYVICNSGNRSRTASEILLTLGYAVVFNVDGGIQAWLAADLPVEPCSP